MLMASLPVGLIVTDLLLWSILPIRRFFEREARGRANGSFSKSMRDSLVLACYWSLPFLVIGIGAAFFGR